MITKGVKNNKGYRFSLPINSPIHKDEKQFYIPPYIMGLFLGDASFRSQPSNRCFNFSSPNEELPKAIAQTMGWSYKRNSLKNYNWTFYSHGMMIHVEDALREYPELINTYSYNKFIPSDYLNSSIQQRKELLMGLLDTDGHVDESKGRVSYSTTSNRLRDKAYRSSLLSSLLREVWYKQYPREDRLRLIFSFQNRNDLSLSSTDFFHFIFLRDKDICL